MPRHLLVGEVTGTGTAPMAAQDPSGDWWTFDVDSDGILVTENVGPTPPTGGDIVISTIPMTQAPDGNWWVQTTDNTGRITTTNVGSVPTTGTPPFATVADLAARTVHVPSVATVDDTGVTNTTASIQALINAAGTGTVFDFGDRRHSYRVTSLVMKSGHSYIANGATITHAAGATEGIFTYKDVAPPRVSIDDVLIQGFIFQGEVSGSAEAERSGVFVVSGDRITVRDCEFYDFKSAAAHCGDCGDVTYENLRTYRCSNGNNGGVAGRNSLEILGVQDVQFPDTTDVAHTWTIRNCKVDNAGAPSGGAGGICVIGNDAQNIRAHVDGNWAFNCLNFAGIAAEAGFAKYSTLTNNKTFCCITGIYSIDTSNDHTTTTVIDRLTISGNVTDAKNVTLSTPANNGATVTVAPNADLPAAFGMDLQASHSTVSGNVVRATNTGIRLRGNTTTTVKVTGTVLSDNQVSIANADSGLTVFGIYLNNALDLNVTGNHVERETAASMKDAYYVDTVTGLSWSNNSSKSAGRSAIRIPGNVVSATFNGGYHLDPSAGEAASGIEVTATGCSHLHFGGGMVIRDSKGSPTMTNGINFGGAIANSDTGELTLFGWTSSAIGGNTNVAVDQSRLYCQETVPKSWGQAGNRFSRTTIANWAARTGSWTRGDRCEYTDPSAAGFFGEVITTSGTPGTSKTYGAITA